MTKIAYETIIRSDGVYAFPPLTAGKGRILELSGGFATGTATLGFVAADGTFVAFTASIGGAPVTLSATGAITVDTPASGRFAISLTGATPGAATLKLSATPVL